MSRLLLQSAILFFVVSTAWSQDQFDSPDLNYEAYLHNIYQQYYSQPLQDSQWESLIGSRATEVYGIQKGDSLWGLSKTFFGDGNYWPKIWSINSRIANPHLIEPANSIRFILGNESDAPAFAIMEAGDSQSTELEDSFNSDQSQMQMENDEVTFAELEAELGSLQDDFLEDDTEFTELEEEYLSDEEIDDIVIPPPSINIVPIAKNYPPSLPIWKSISGQLLQSMEIQMNKNEIKNLDPIIPLTYFIDENQPEGIGRVVGIESGNNFGAEFQYIYVRVRNGAVTQGQTYLAMENKGPLIGVYGNEELGIIYEVQGLISVGDKVEATDRHKSKYYEVYRAKVVNTLSAINIGSELFISDYIYTQLDNHGRIPKVSGMIVGGEYANKRNIVTTGSLVYVNRGSGDGVKVGDVLPVYSNNYIDDENPYIVTNSQPMGLLKVAKVSELYTTGYIVESTGPINIGDFVGVKDNFEKNYLGEEKYEKFQQQKRQKEKPLKGDLMSIIEPPPPTLIEKASTENGLDEGEFLDGDFQLENESSVGSDDDELLFDE